MSIQTFSIARFAFSILAIFAVGPTGVNAQGAVKMALDWNFEGHHSPYVWGVESGLYKKLGVSVTVDRGFGSGDTVTKVASGSYDVGVADIGSVIAFNSKNGHKLITVMQVFDRAPLSVMALKGSGITSPKDLTGKKIAAPPGDSSRVMFPVFAKANNLGPVEWIDVTPPLRGALLVKRQADAVTAQSSEVITFRNLGVNSDDLIVLRYGDYGVNLYGHAIVTTPEFAANHRKELEAYVKGTVAGWKTAFKDPKATIAALKKAHPLINEGIELERLNLMLRENIATPNVLKNGLSSVDPQRLQFTIDVITQSFGLTNLPKASDLYHPEFLPSREDRSLSN